MAGMRLRALTQDHWSSPRLAKEYDGSFAVPYHARSASRQAPSGPDYFLNDVPIQVRVSRQFMPARCLPTHRWDWPRHRQVGRSFLVPRLRV